MNTKLTQITLALVALMAMNGCNTDGPAHITEIECRLNSDCSLGEYCDSFSNLCGFDCRDDEECEVGMYCDAHNGRCLREEELPPVPDHIGPVLEVVAGDLSDMTVLTGDDVELYRYDIINHDTRDIVLRLLPVGILLVDGAFASAGSFTDVKVVDRADNRVLMGPQDLMHEVGAVIYLEDEFTLPAGETTTLVLRADIHIAGRYTIRAGSLRGLIEDAVYADAPESVPFERILNNDQLGRNIDVMNVDEMPSDTTALVLTYTPMQGILHPSDEGWNRVGTVTLESFGGDSVFRGMDVTGANIGAFTELAFADDLAGFTIGMGTATIPACSCGQVRLDTARIIRDGERHQLGVFARMARDSRPSLVTLSPNGSAVDAGSAAGSLFRMVVTSHGQSEFRVFPNHPMVSVQALPTTTIVNGSDTDLFRVRLSPAREREPLYVGSMTLRFGGVGAFGGHIENIRVRVGSTELPREQYRIYSTFTGEETSAARSFAEQLTFVFNRDLGGLGIGSSGNVVTIVGRPEDFAFERDTIMVGFGDRIFSGASPAIWGTLDSRGRITPGMGLDGLIDPIAWAAGPTMGYTGAWMISDLTASVTLTR